MSAAMEAAQDSTPRPYLGVSQLGHKCERHLWLSFRFAEARRMPASALRAIEDGHRGEDVMAERLRMVPGIVLHTVDPATRQQFAVEYGSHVRGHLDGIITGLLEAPKTPHVWEHKQVNDKKFAVLRKLVEAEGEKRALKLWDETYHAQALCYMRLRKLPRHFLTVGTPGGRDYISVRTEADDAAADRLLQRADRIVHAAEPPLRISEDPAWYECKFCPFHAQCHGTEAPQVNCRTCAHSTPEADGTWACRRHEAGGIPLDFQRTGCGDHIFIPPLLARLGEPVDASEDNGVVYRTPDGRGFINGPAGWSSAEIRACQDKRFLTAAADMPDVQQWRREFGATIAR